MVIFILTFTESYSQEYVDVVYLKNGNIVKGIIFSQDFKEYVKIMSGENILVIRMDEILKIVKEEVEPKGNSKDTARYERSYRPHYFTQFEFGVTPLYMIGELDISTKSLRVDVKGGYQVNQLLALTAGTGLRYLITDTNETGAGLYKYRTSVPFLLGLRLISWKKDVSPCFEWRVGYSWDASRNFSRLGPVFNVSAGMTVKISEKKSLNMGIGYETYLFNSPDGDTFLSSMTTKYENLTLMVGFSF
jgi:hypothetical protein